MQALKSPEALFISVPLSVQKQSVVQQVSRKNHNMKQNIRISKTFQRLQNGARLETTFYLWKIYFYIKQDV